MTLGRPHWPGDCRGALQTARSYGSRLLGKLKGQHELTVDDGVLRLLALRQRQLLAALEGRGHAATARIKLTLPSDKGWREGKLPEALSKGAGAPAVVVDEPRAKLGQAERQEQIDSLVQEL
ncbi:DUF3482 domain-containing protein [Pseudomonas qingdaonensis]|nr:DUF3482 domain-containing protein [Pseudomonas qingdaonensis]